MCGRFTLHPEPARIREQFQVDRMLDLAPRFNIAPSQDVAAVRTAPDGCRELVLLHWGLVPRWADQAKTGYSTINARAETVASKPAYREAYRRRRCLIPADGFYEWAAVPGGKQPHYFSLRDGSPFAFAGLWERWEKAGEALESCAIIVTEANALVRPIHDRMPVILAPADYALWLDPDMRDAAKLEPLLRPLDARKMSERAVSRRVNSPANDDPRCIEPAKPE